MAIEPNRYDVWGAGDLYESYVGQWSRQVAALFLEWLNPPAGRDWLDVGCGTGAMTKTILHRAAPKSVKGVDPSPDFLRYAKADVDNARAKFEVGDAQSIPAEPESVDVAVAALSLNFVPDPSRAAAEMVRVTRPGGMVAAYVWDYAGAMEMLRHFWDAAAALDPAAAELDEGRRFPLCRPGPLTALFTNAGLMEVDVRAIDVPTPFRTFDEFWAPFLGAQGPAPGYAMSLSEERRAALRERIRSALPIENDGSIRLMARAWAVRGRKP
jgi:SAM-dependent methyltransferase